MPVIDYVRCSACDDPVPYEINVGKDGTHRDAECDHCGADLQWDQPVLEGARPGIIRTGAPQACQHAERRREGAKVPRASS